jgi:hypothetical protein
MRQSSADESELRELYAIYRDYLKHEDDLLSGRLARFFAVQSILFAGCCPLNYETMKEAKAIDLVRQLQSFSLTNVKVTMGFLIACLLCLFGVLRDCVDQFDQGSDGRKQ